MVFRNNKAILYQNITFNSSDGKTRTISRFLQEAENGPIEANSTDSWEDIPLTIPSVPPTGLGGCRIIEVTYRLLFIVRPRGFGFDLSVSLPIEIGNIPLESSLVQNNSARVNDPNSSEANSPQHIQESSTIPYDPVGYKAFPLLSYKDALAVYDDRA